MDKHTATVNLATLPLDDAMSIARAGGANFLSEPDIVAEVRNGISTVWLSKHMPWGCPDMTDEEFDARMAALYSAFHDGLDEVVLKHRAPVVTRGTGKSYKAGVKMAVNLLSSWEARGESGMTPAQLTAELLKAIAERNGSLRDGLTDTIAAFIILALDGIVPTPKTWDVLDDLESRGGSHE
jgi:hypothetical protein